MTPKPPVVRPGWRRHVTIIAGFRCFDGIVICADTLETVAEISKRNIPKLIYEPADAQGRTQALRKDDLAVAFCGASNNGPFVDKLVSEAWDDAQEGTNLDKVCELIETSIQRTYQRFGAIFQPGYCPSADLIYGVKMHGASKLFSATGPVIVEQKRYYAGGAGYYMADFLASRMYRRGMTVRQCVILGAYVLFQAKEHVDGCGGESQIAILRDKGVSGMVDSLRVESLNRILETSDAYLSNLLLNAADLEIDKFEFSQLMEMAKKMLEDSRGGEMADYSLIKGLTEDVRVIYPDKEHIDEFGLPMPSDPQT